MKQTVIRLSRKMKLAEAQKLAKRLGCELVCVDGGLQLRLQRSYLPRSGQGQ